MEDVRNPANQIRLHHQDSYIQFTPLVMYAVLLVGVIFPTICRSTVCMDMRFDQSQTLQTGKSTKIIISQPRGLL